VRQRKTPRHRRASQLRKFLSATTSSTEDVTSTNVGCRGDNRPGPLEKTGLLPPQVFPPNIRQASKASQLRKFLAFAITSSTEDLVGYKRRLLAGPTTPILWRKTKALPLPRKLPQKMRQARNEDAEPQLRLPAARLSCPRHNIFQKKHRRLWRPCRR
jgi:hypothetical protein